MSICAALHCLRSGGAGGGVWVSAALGVCVSATGVWRRAAVRCCLRPACGGPTYDLGLASPCRRRTVRVAAATGEPAPVP